MKRNPVPIAQFVDKYGETRVIHRKKGNDKGTLAVARQGTTITQAMGCYIGVVISKRLKERRIELGMTMPELCEKAALKSVSPKSRIYEIENNYNGGIRLGTLYALCMALNVSPFEVLPSINDVIQNSPVELADTKVLSMRKA